MAGISQWIWFCYQAYKEKSEQSGWCTQQEGAWHASYSHKNEQNGSKEQNFKGFYRDQHFVMIKGELQRGNSQQRIEDYRLQEDGILLYSRRVYVPNSVELRNDCFKKNNAYHWTHVEKLCIWLNACRIRIHEDMFMHIVNDMIWLARSHVLSIICVKDMHVNNEWTCAWSWCCL